MPELPQNESRSIYIVTQPFEAAVFDEGAYRIGDEQYGEDVQSIQRGAHVFADPEAWRGRKWKGRFVVSFTQGRVRYMAAFDTFLAATQQTFPSEKENEN